MGRTVQDKKVHAVDGGPSTATVAAVEDTGEIDEAGICGCCSDDDDSGVDTSEACSECGWVTTCQQPSSLEHSVLVDTG